MSKQKLSLIFVVSLLAIAILAVVAINHRQNSKQIMQEEDSLTIGYDYPVASNLQQMIESADFIVVGEYTGSYDSWNMARNPDNIREEDTANYVEGRLYDFQLDTCIKGSINDESIIVNHRYAELISTTESNAVIDEEGRILKEATESRTISFNMISPLFIEPELNCKYILFLSKDANFNNYFGAIEPFSIKSSEGIATIQSNIINRTADWKQTIKVDDSKDLTIIIDMGNITTNDEVTGRSFEEIVTIIEKTIAIIK